ncbi:helix-turn-helix transcriptional regulator [Azospirillum sp. YIM B02556]|uniref:Helix-turn-helix transcriptional regulator n=1 Tax=Azospirillum endophyticum TaxID=2800326 RepID=A0ABS1FEV7_9PROT|nr:helix-turn-helix transcriptional regulator [Azospirillum endophyticum]MBK1841949.1 helix-turn-helix transcriptional regulator [Azospirillum endophyticum]
MVCHGDMQGGTVSHHGLLAAWAETSADLVEAIEDPVFPIIFSRSLARLISFDACTQTVYDGRNGPVPLGDDGRDRRADGPPPHPFQRMYRAGIRSGVYLLRDILRFGHPAAGGVAGGVAGGGGELCIVLPMSGDACTLVVLTRRPGGPGFTDAEVRTVRTVLPFLTSVFRRHWQSAGMPADGRDDSRPDHQPDGIDRGLLQRIDRLSPREKEIVGLLIGGHSTLSISLRLDISGTTVKTHRKNLYSKLGVGTIHELFSLYGTSIKERMARSC